MKIIHSYIYTDNKLEIEQYHILTEKQLEGFKRWENLAEDIAYHWANTYAYDMEGWIYKWEEVTAEKEIIFACKKLLNEIISKKKILLEKEEEIIKNYFK